LSLEAAKNRVVDLTPLASLPGLERLVLSGNQISDLAPLRSLPVSFLVLNDNPLAGIEPLAELPTLAHLSIDHTGQSELATLVVLEGLSILSAVGNGISDLSFVEELVLDPQRLASPLLNAPRPPPASRSSLPPSASRIPRPRPRSRSRSRFAFAFRVRVSRPR
jgi:Leucine-rich repeat (LRR) protein